MYYQNAWKDQLTRIQYYINGSLNYYQTFTYDASGNVINLVDSRTSSANKNYQWDGRQLSYYSSYCNMLSFKYNDQGIRTRKSQGTCAGNVTTDYVLDGDKVLVESRSNGITLYFTYDVDGTLLSMNYNGNEYFYITNMQGDVIELVDINGNSVVKYKYDAWGNIISQTGGSLADINPYRYRGYRYDVETGLYYLQSRYYDPTIGRFISSDGLFGQDGHLLSNNTYAYSFNNPVIFVDNDGRFAWAIPGAIIGAIAGGIAGAIISYNKTGEVDWRYVAIGAAGGALIGAGAGYLAQAAFTAATTTTATANVVAGGTTLTSVGGALAADGDPTNEIIKCIEISDDVMNQLRFTQTVLNHTDRSYNNLLVIREILTNGRMVPDPQGAINSFQFTANGSLLNSVGNVSQGTYELVVDVVQWIVYHLQFS